METVNILQVAIIDGALFHVVFVDHTWGYISLS